MGTKRYFPSVCDELLSSTTPSRASVDRLVRRAKALPERDLALVEAVYLRHHHIAAVARLRGQPVRVVRRRLRQIIARVHTPEFVYVLRCRARWSEPQRAVATAIFIQGLTTRQATRALRLPYFTVRRLHDAVRALIDGAIAESTRPTSAEQHAFALREVA